MYAANASPVIPCAFPTISHGGECSGNESFCFFAGLAKLFGLVPGAAFSVAESHSLSTSFDISKHTTSLLFPIAIESLSLSTREIFAKTT